MLYDVTLRPVYCVKVVRVEADSPKEAMLRAREAVDFDELAASADIAQSSVSYRVESMEFSDDFDGAIVDEYQINPDGSLWLGNDGQPEVKEDNPKPPVSVLVGKIIGTDDGPINYEFNPDSLTDVLMDIAKTGGGQPRRTNKGGLS